MSYAGFKICQAFATADVLVISFLGIDISKTFLRYKYTILFFISPILLVASRRCYAISERTGSNQHYGSDEITIISSPLQILHLFQYLRIIASM
jgi:hypothetical protein